MPRSSEPRWSVPTRQVQGRQTERELLTKRGKRVHPNSGAGRIKYDGSDDDEVIEVKDAAKGFRLVGRDLLQFHQHAAREGKDAVWYITFEGLDGWVAEVRLVPARS